MIIVDTNIVSEPLRSQPEPRVIEWLNSQALETLYLSAGTIAEMRLGIALILDDQRRTQLRDRIEATVLTLFAGRILPFDLSATQYYADLIASTRHVGITISVADGLIAATAASHRMMVATRDTTPFTEAGLKTINPWEQTA